MKVALRILLGLSMLLAAHLSFARRLWVLQGMVNDPIEGVGPYHNCSPLTFNIVAVFHNVSTTEQVVQLVDASVGPVLRNNSRVVIPPGRTVVTSGSAGTFLPSDLGTRVIELEVPDTVLVASRMEILSGDPAQCGVFIGGSPPPPGPYRGHVALPVFTSLVPAGEPQVRLGIENGTIPSRLNVVIYNRSTSASAFATIDIRRACDDVSIGVTTTAIPANALVQIPVEFYPSEGTSPLVCQGSISRADGWMYYSVVTVDQPSVTIVSTIASDRDLIVPISVQ